MALHVQSAINLQYSLKVMCTQLAFNMLLGTDLEKIKETGPDFYWGGSFQICFEVYMVYRWWDAHKKILILQFSDISGPILFRSIYLSI